ncbi:MAG TPA: hypothetical protein VL172_21470, partial [Kofleriaceae bacterium]|nr:hypothetical protein [Kofleriaceae bacterium]
MKRSLAILLLLASAAHADEPPAPPPAKPAPKLPAIDKDLVDQMYEAQEALRRHEFADYAHAERVTRDKAAQARILIKLLPMVLERRAVLAARLEELEAAGRFTRKAEPLALWLIGQMYVAQADTIDRFELQKEALPEKERAVAPDLSAYKRGAEAAIPAWQQLADRFPRHRAVTDALDELADAYADAGRADEAKLALQRLLCRNRDAELLAAGKKAQGATDDLAARVLAQQNRIADYRGCRPRLDDEEMVDDAWLRLAWLHRGASGELPQAISAYEQVTGRPSSPAYVNALHEMAVAYYEGDRGIEAVPVLDALVEYLDRKTDEDKVDDETWPELRKQAVERMGRILAELWRDSAKPDENAARDLALIYFRGRSHQRHVREVFMAAAEALRSFGAFDQALPMWNEVLTTWPDHPGAPAAQAHLIALLVEKGDSTGADAARRRFLDTFGKGSRWRRANRRNPQALARADRTGEEVLFTLAGNRYRQMAIADEAGGAAAAELAADAAALGQRFVDEYPRSRLAYEASFRLAHALLVAGQRDRAVQRLRAVRDADRRGVHFGEATRYVVDALEQAREQAVAAGQLTEP